MRAKLVGIGNSRGIRIPKTLLEQGQFKDEVEMELVDGCLVIRPAVCARNGWDEAFRHMHEHGDDALLDEESPTGTAWDAMEWEW